MLSFLGWQYLFNLQSVFFQILVILSPKWLILLPQKPAPERSSFIFIIQWPGWICNSDLLEGCWLISHSSILLIWICTILSCTKIREEDVALVACEYNPSCTGKKECTQFMLHHRSRFSFQRTTLIYVWDKVTKHIFLLLPPSFKLDSVFAIFSPLCSTPQIILNCLHT